MSDREQRLRWIESLISSDTDEADRASALVIPAASGSFAIAFDSIVEVVPADHMKPLSLLPKEFCGVLNRDNALIPIIATGRAEDVKTHIVVIESGGCMLGLQFEGVPTVVDLDKTAHAPLALDHATTQPPDILPVLDVDAVMKVLLALE